VFQAYEYTKANRERAQRECNFKLAKAYLGKGFFENVGTKAPGRKSTFLNGYTHLWESLESGRVNNYWTLSLLRKTLKPSIKPPKR
jgi:hypothetical protein